MAMADTNPVRVPTSVPMTVVAEPVAYLGSGVPETGKTLWMILADQSSPGSRTDQDML